MRFPKALQGRSLVARAGLIVLVFVGFSLLWIPITDQILGWLVQDPVQLTRLATYKGSLYIAIVALFLFWLVLSTLEATRKEREEVVSPRGIDPRSEMRSLWAPLALFAAAGLLLAALGTVIFKAQRGQVEQRAQAELTDHAGLLVDQIEDWLQEGKSDALVAARDPFLHGELQRLAQAPGLVGQIRGGLTKRLKTLQEAYHQDAVLVVDPNGKLIAAADGQELDPAERLAVERLVAGGSLAWSLQAQPGGEARVRLSFCTSILDANRALGVLVVRTSLDRLLVQTLRNAPTYRGTLETHLVWQQGEELVHLDPAHRAESRVNRLPMARRELVAVQALVAGAGTFQGVDDRGIPTIAVARRLASLPWVLYTRMDAEELSIPLQRLSLIYGGVALLFLTLASIALFIWRRREARIVLAERHRIQAQNELLEYRLEFLSQHANDIVLLVEPGGHIRYANDRAVEAYGYSQLVLQDLNIQDLQAPETLGEVPAQMSAILASGALRFETIHRRKDGSRFPVEVSSRTLLLEDSPCIQSIIRDISERRQAELALQSSGERYRRLFDEAVEGIALVDVDRLQECNQAFVRLLGLERKEVVGASLERFQTPQQLGLLREHIRLVLRGEAPVEAIATRLLTGSGAEKEVEIKVNRVELDGQWLALAFCRDLTEERQRQFERETTLNLLRLLNERNHLHELLGNLTRYIQEWSGCEAVGIRLREGEDFPYFETRGFPAAFVELERSLCVRDLEGQWLRDAAGNPVLECMCGNILCGRFNPELPFFTAHGSFWSNGTTALLASTSEQDRQARTRNRCNGEGYESVALVPLRSGREVFGLLQLNDHAKDRFTPERIAFLEGVGEQIALALGKRQALLALEYSEKRFRALNVASGAFLWETDATGNFLFISERCQSVLGYSPEELVGRNSYELIAYAEAESLLALVGVDRDFVNLEVPLVAKTGGIVWVSMTTKIQFDDNGNKTGAFGTGTDITERKEAERKLGESERKLASLIGNLPGFVYRCANDKAWTMEFISEGCRAVTGYAPVDFLGNEKLAFRELIPSQHRETIWRAWQQTLDFHETFEGEYPITTASGETRWVWERGSGIRDEAGRLLFLEGFITDITPRKQAEAMLLQSEAQNQALIKAIPDLLFTNKRDGEFLAIHAPDPSLLYVPPENFPHRKPEDVMPKPLADRFLKAFAAALDAGTVQELDYTLLAGGQDRHFEARVAPSTADTVVTIVRDITEQKRAIEVIEKRIVALTQPLEGDAVTFEELFNLADIQHLQDTFAKATGVASIITHPDGTPLTAPSRFTPLCSEIIRRTELGCANCFRSDAAIGRYHPEGPIVQPCLSGGLWDAGASITVGGKHIANWLIGQVRDETQTEEGMRAYARAIGAEESACLAAFQAVPAMSREHFEEIAQSLFTLASQLSTAAYQNVQQARFITERKRAEQALLESEEKFSKAFRQSPILVSISTLAEGNFLEVNGEFCRLLEWTREDLIGHRAEDLVLWVDPGLRNRLVAELQELGFVRDREIEIHAKSGRILTLLWSAELITIREQPCLLASAVDISERQAIRLELESSKQLLQQVLDTLPIPVFGKDLEGRYFLCNQAFPQFLGRAASEVLGHTAFEIAPPSLAETYHRSDLALMAAGSNQQYEALVEGGAGLRQVLFTKNVMRNPAGAVTGLVGAILDITERKQTELALQKSERFLQQAQRVGHIGCYSLDFATGEWESSESLDEIFGIGPAYPRDVQGWLQLVVPESRAALGKHLETIVLERSRFEYDYQIIRGNDGEERWVSGLGALELDEDGHPIRMLGTIQDITDWKRAETDVHSKNELLSLTGSMAKVGGWAFDPKTLKGTWTDEVAIIHDLDPRLETNVEIGVGFYTPESRKRIEAAIAEAIGAGKPYDLELEIISAKGIRKDVRTVCHPTVNEQREVVQIRGIFQDITERKAAEAVIRWMTEDLEMRVKERTAQLEATNQELEAFSYSVSHDLRGPLRGIDGFSRALQEDYRDRLDEEGKHYLDRIRTGTQRMGQLIDDLLKLSRINRSELDRVHVDLSGICTKVLSDLARAHPERRVEVLVQPGLSAQADRRLLLVVLENLLGNAWKFTAKCAEARIEVGESTSPDGERVFFLQDNGAGFDMAYLDKLFNAFQRLHTAEEFEGTGIGLAIVQRVIRRHGGRVWAEAETGKGATFFFTLQ